MKHHIPPAPFGHSLEAFSPEMSASVPQSVSDAPPQRKADSGLSGLHCSCGCCGGHEKENQPHGLGSKKKLAVAGVLAALSEGVHFMLEGGAWASPGFWDHLPLIFALAAIALSGVDTFKAGWSSLFRLKLNMTALMSVAVTGAVIIGQYSEAAMVMVLFNVSEEIEERIIEKARRAISDLLTLSPDRATVRQPDGSWLETDCRSVPSGAIVRVKPGERIPLDGIVREGRSVVDQSPITGESMPVEKEPGDTVFAGTLNTSGSFDFEVTASACDSTLARIIRTVEQAQAHRAPVERFVDRFARWYTPCIFALALLLALVPMLFSGAEWRSSLYTALVVLVIGCPCALVISTPVTIMGGMAAATRQGILVKGGSFLEQGRLLRVLAVDKTGTLTQGRPRLVELVPFDAEELVALARAASLAERSGHPVSRAVAEAFAGELADVKDFKELPGLGLHGSLDGQKYSFGNLRMMESLGLLAGEQGEKVRLRAAALEEAGRTVTALAEENRVMALFAVADTLRESSVQAVRELRELGVRTVMLTGDREASARAIAELAGVDECRAELLPEDKLAWLERLSASQKGLTGMVGDGINDAPALARSDIGFAMAGSGTDTAMETADVALMDDDLRKVPRFIRLSRHVHSVLMQNIILALGVKALFFVLTLAGYTSMWMAVFADVGVTLIVVGNGLRTGFVKS